MDTMYNQVTKKTPMTALGARLWPRAVFVALAVGVLLSSCATMDEQQPEETVETSEQMPIIVTGDEMTPVGQFGLSSSASALAQEQVNEQRARPAPVLYRGTDNTVNMPASKPSLKLIGDSVSLNFEQAPLSEVMHAIMSDILQLDYVVDQPVEGKVTLRTRTPVPRDQLLGILESLLQANNVLMIRGEDNRFLITGSEQGMRLSPGVSNPQSTGAGYSTMIIPLRYISAANMAEILGPVASDSAFVRVDNARNLLMLAGTRAQLDGWLEMVGTFDVDLLKGMSVGLFPLEHSSVNEINTALTALLSGASGSGTLSDLAHLVRIIPIERLNSILVVTPRAHYLDRIQLWVERLDTTPDANFEKRLYVYEVQNTTAGRLAKLLTSIYAGGGGRGAGLSSSVMALADQVSDTGVAPGLSQESLGDSSSGGGSSLGAGLPGSTGKAPELFTSSMVASASGGSGSVVDDVRVVADDENNALMIYAAGRQYEIIETALKQLDVVATQVIIEASILEVQLTDELKYGLEWTFKNGLGSDYDGVGLLAAAAGGPAATVPGFSYTVSNSIGDISAVLNALSTASLINIISTPSVMVLDNHTAYIHVGDQVPTFDQQVESDGGRITQSVTYKDTGVKLSVKPSVNAGGLVTMDIEQSVTDVGEIDAATGQRSFLERNIMSRVAVRSEESVVLGGLIRENATSGSAGIPILHKLPVVGGLFGTVTDTDRRTELLVIITPRALYNESELREVSREMRSQVRHMELIEVPPM